MVGGFALQAALAACGEAGRDDTVVRHPVPDSLLSTVSGRLSASNSDPTPSTFLSLFTRRDDDQRFGMEKGLASDVFGAIVSAEVLPDGRVVLLDASYGLVRVHSGSEIGITFGGLGEGPGSFVEPVKLVSHGDTLYVLDRARTLHVLSLPRQGAPAWARTVRLPLDAEDACFSSRGLIALAPPVSFRGGGAPDFTPNSGVLHRLSADGEVLESFYVPYRTDSRAVAQSFSAGRLLCNFGDGSVTIGFSSLGEVHHLSKNGETRWITRLPDYSYPPLEERPNGTVGPARDYRSSIDQVSSISLFADSLIVASVTSTAVFQPGRPVTHRLAILRRRDGTFLGYYADESVSAVLFGSTRETLIYRDFPYPEVSRRGMGNASIGAQEAR
jgi:hypothetical protein